MKYATGRGTGCRHSTSMEWDEVERKQRQTRLRYSTGRKSPLRHSCGALMDDEPAEKENQPRAELALTEEENETGKKGRGFKRVVADY